MIQRHRLRDQPAHGYAADNGLADLKSIQYSDQVARQIVSRIRRLCRLGQSMSAQIVANDAKITHQTRRNIVPDAQIAAERVGEHDHLFHSRPLIGVAMDDVVDLDKRHDGSVKLSERVIKSQL